MDRKDSEDMFEAELFLEQSKKVDDLNNDFFKYYNALTREEKIDLLIKEYIERHTLDVNQGRY